MSSEYLDSGALSTTPEDEVDCQTNGGPKTHRVSQDVLQKIRECGISVTYYGGKVVQSHNGPLVSPAPPVSLRQDCLKFRLVKSNSCDSRLELAGRYMEVDSGPMDAEVPSIEIASLHLEQQEVAPKREPPVVIASEPKRDESRHFRADFRLGKLDSGTSSRFASSALSEWHVNENLWRKNEDFGQMQFEEFEVLEDSLNDNRSKAI